LNAAIQIRLGNVFSSTPLAILQPRTAIAWQIESEDRAACRLSEFSATILRRYHRRCGRRQPALRQNFSGRLLGTVGGTTIAPGIPNSAVDATVAANQTFSSGFAQGQLSCASAQANPATCLPPVAITAVPDGKLHAPYFMEWSFGLEHQLGTTGSFHAQYVGTRAVNQPYLTQVNGYQSVCPGCFAPFRYAQSHASPIGAVTQFSHRREQSLPVAANDRNEAFGNGFMGQLNYTPGAVAWTPSQTADSCNSRREESSRLSQETLARDYGPCDYDIRHNLNAQYVFQLPVKVQNRLLWLRAERLAGVGNRVLAQRDSVPPS